MMSTENQQHKQLADQLYDQYGKSLEAEHSGKYVAITPDGELLLGETMLETAQRAGGAFGPGTFLFKVGTKAVGKWR